MVNASTPDTHSWAGLLPGERGLRPSSTGTGRIEHSSREFPRPRPSCKMDPNREAAGSGELAARADRGERWRWTDIGSWPSSGRAPMASRIARRSRARADRSTKRSSNSATWAARRRTPRDGGTWLARSGWRRASSIRRWSACSIRGWIATLLTWRLEWVGGDDAGRCRGLVGADAARRRDGAGRLPGRRAGGGASPGPGPWPARARPGLPRRRPAQARLHRHRRRLPGRVAGIARARRGLPRSAVRRRRRPGGRSRGRPLRPGRAARLAVDGRDRARGPRAVHGRPGFRPDPGGIDPRPARGRAGRSPVGPRGPRAARRGDRRPRSSTAAGPPRSPPPATGPGPGRRSRGHARASRPPRPGSAPLALEAGAARLGPLSPAGQAGRGRPGGRLSRRGPGRRDDRRDQGPQERTRRRRDGTAAVPQGSQTPGRGQQPARGQPARIQRGRRHPVPRPRIRVGRGPRPPAPPSRPARRTRGPGHHGRGRARADGRPRARDRPPRHQAEQYPAAPRGGDGRRAGRYALTS